MYKIVKAEKLAANIFLMEVEAPRVAKGRRRMQGKAEYAQRADRAADAREKGGRSGKG